MPAYLQHHGQPAPRLRVGLVNNMPEAAFAATERQFLSLIDKASGKRPIAVSLFTLPGLLPAGQQGRYQGLDALMRSEIDGLIVTGREPLAHDLRAEPYWDSFCVLLAWARTHTGSTLWSCLAAHAAVLQLDGITRQKRTEKYSGIFPCSPAAFHPLTAHAAAPLRFPHSRWNGLHGEELANHGYQVLTTTADGEVDLFLKTAGEGGSLFLFVQGHPEYDTDTLLREYRRDVGRYVRHQTELFPATPTSYFDAPTESALRDVAARAPGDRTEALLAESLAALGQARVENTWAASAECLYRGWLALLATRSAARHPVPLMASAEGSLPMLAI